MAIIHPLVRRLAALNQGIADRIFPPKQEETKSLLSMPHYQPRVLVMETPNRKLLETIARTVFPERFKVDPQGTLILAFKWWRENVQEFQPLIQGCMEKMPTGDM